MDIGEIEIKLGVTFFYENGDRQSYNTQITTRNKDGSLGEARLELEGDPITDSKMLTAALNRVIKDMNR